MRREAVDSLSGSADTRVGVRAFPFGSDGLAAAALGNLRLVLVLLISRQQRPGCGSTVIET
jgi:hypothetical protein